MQTQITTDDVRELAESKKMIPLLVRWMDTGEIEIVAAVGLHHGNPFGNTENKRPHRAIANQDDLFDIVAKPLTKYEKPDFERIALYLNKSENAHAAARVLGSQTSERKKLSSAANGKKGGRPPRKLK